MAQGRKKFIKKGEKRKAKGGSRPGSEGEFFLRVDQDGMINNPFGLLSRPGAKFLFIVDLRERDIRWLTLQSICRCDQCTTPPKYYSKLGMDALHIF